MAITVFFAAEVAAVRVLNSVTTGGSGGGGSGGGSGSQVGG